MGCRQSTEGKLLPRAQSPEEELEKKSKTQLLVHHAARRPPLPWEEELCMEMMELLGKTATPIRLSPRDVRRFALQFCYGNLKDTSEDTVQRCIRRALQLNRAMQEQGYRYFRVVLANSGTGSMTGSVLKGLVLRTAEEVGEHLITQTAVSQAFSGRTMTMDSSDDDELADVDDVADVTEDLDAVFG